MNKTIMNVQKIIRAYEHEVVQWVKNHHKELGYDKILSENKDKIPDFIMVRNCKNIKVEIEIYASHFLKHKHDPKKVDEVLCVVPLKQPKLNNSNCGTN